MKGTVIINLDSIDLYGEDKSGVDYLKKLVNLISENDYWVEVTSKEFNFLEGMKHLSDFLNNNAKQLLNKISNIDKNMNEKDIYVIDINTIREGKMYSV